MEDSIELRIEKLVYGGDGIGRLDGQAVFVTGTAPGDLAIVRPIKRTKGFIRAELEKIVEPGPARREAPCEYFGRCGGCQLQHLLPDAQRDARRGFVGDALRRIAATTACHAAVKANYPLTHEKMLHILEELRRTAYSTVCPHGRPVMLRLSRRELEKNFQRI